MLFVGIAAALSLLKRMFHSTFLTTCGALELHWMAVVLASCCEKEKALVKARNKGVQ